MTTKDYSKVRNQLMQKPAKWAKYVKHNKPKDKKFGLGNVHCKICGSTKSHISSFGLDVCRKCFRQHAKKLGFKKLD